MTLVLFKSFIIWLELLPVKSRALDWFICRSLFSCNARVLDYGPANFKTNKPGHFESVSQQERKEEEKHNE